MYMQKNRHDQTGHCDAPTLNSSSECKVIRFVSRTKLTVFRLRSVCASNLSTIHLMALNHNICLLTVVLSVCDSPFIPIQFNRLAQQPTTYPFKQTDPDGQACGYVIATNCFSKETTVMTSTFVEPAMPASHTT